MVLSGIISLIDRKIMASMQLRLGPSIFAYGLLTPIFDGVKLLLKFPLIVLNINIFYLFTLLVLALIANYLIIFFVPVSTILFMDSLWFFLILLCFHAILFICDTVVFGIFIVTSCFIYMATLRSILCSFLSEFLIIVAFLNILISNNLFYDLLTSYLVQSGLATSLRVNVTVLTLFIVATYLNIMINIFEYAEAEAELVAGTITEFAGIFFCVSSLIEIFHALLMTICITCFFFGGVQFTIKLSTILLLYFIIPKMIICRLKLNSMIWFSLFYILFITSLLLFISCCCYLLTHLLH